MYELVWDPVLATSAQRLAMIFKNAKFKKLLFLKRISNIFFHTFNRKPQIWVNFQGFFTSSGGLTSALMDMTITDLSLDLPLLARTRLTLGTVLTVLKKIWLEKWLDGMMR
jgi:hypothetical protein